MHIAIEFNPSAFKQGISESDIRNAIKTKVYAALLSDFPDKYAVIGFDTRGNPLEVRYNPIDGDTINVFHAMKVRKNFLAELGL